VIHAFICLNALIAKAFIRLTLTTVLSGNTTSTRSGLQKNMPKSEKPGKIRFVHLWMVMNYDFRKPQNLFAKCPKKQFHHQNDS